METHYREIYRAAMCCAIPWPGAATCPAAEAYRASLLARFRLQAHNLSFLTGWDAKEIATRMEAAGQSVR